ncbi:hypothetical protein [Avibacterium paragallinarum]|uniref:hypothetical protein n=1 Tax=Avibacterium paragallinarum TaxID=728 RepID=UPI0018901D25|nr:hypothetical protein [Avibacterium paragallinarum]
MTALYCWLIAFFFGLITGFAVGDLLSFACLKESRQRKSPPIKLLIFIFNKFS